MQVMCISHILQPTRLDTDIPKCINLKSKGLQQILYVRYEQQCCGSVLTESCYQASSSFDTYMWVFSCVLKITGYRREKWGERAKSFISGH